MTFNRQTEAACAAALVSALLWVAPSAYALDAAAIATQGNGKGAVACQLCHGVDGAGQPAAGFPRLAGLNSGYMRKQLEDYANGTRDNAVMKPIAMALSATERQSLARYYSELPIPASWLKPAAALPAADSAGALLATRGRWSEQEPACEQCHGPAGMGVGESFPPLAGQPALYIEAQLNAWKQGARHNDPLQLMQHIASSLSAADITAVSSWFAAQPLSAHAEGP